MYFVEERKYKEPPMVGLKPSGMDVSDLKSKEPPTVGLKPSGMDVSDPNSKEPPIFSSPKNCFSEILYLLRNSVFFIVMVFKLLH